MDIETKQRQVNTLDTKKRSNKKKWLTIGYIAIIMICCVIFLLMKPKSIKYESAVAKTGDITTYYSFSGNVETKNRQTVMSEKMMQISHIYVKEGDSVKNGDVLIKTTMGDVIKSKIDGVITNVNVKENAQVMSGIKLLELVDNKHMKINVKVDEYDIIALTVGKDTKIKIDALDKEITGKVKSISEEGQIVNGVTYFTATINLENDNSIKIGMSAEVKMIREQAVGVIILPMSAILFDEYNNPYVLKIDDKGIVNKTKITIGINDGTYVQIKSGVSNNETVYYTKAATEEMDFRGGVKRNTSDGGNK